MGSIKAMPTNWNQITVGNFIHLCEIQAAKYEHAIDMDINIIALLTERTIDEVNEMNLLELKKEVGKLKFMEKLPKEKIQSAFYVKGQMYDVCLDMTKLTGAQVVDIQHFFEKGKENPITQAHNLLACLCRKRKWLLLPGKYDGKGHSEVASAIFLNLTMDIAYPILLFFSKVGNSLLPDIQNYLILRVAKMRQQIEKLIKEETNT